MADKKKLERYLPDTPAQPAIRRGQGLQLTTEIAAQEEAENSRNREIEKRRKVENKVPRQKPGYEIRTDLLKAVKRLALEEDRFNYEIIEEALEQYLTARGRL